MELWIRSQDKTALTSVDNICAIENRIVFIPNRVNGRATLGKYKTEKRALEVLDEIQKLIAGKTICNFNGMYKPEDMRNKMEELGIVGLYADVSYDIQQLGDNVVYEMPEE